MTRFQNCDESNIISVKNLAISGSVLDHVMVQEAELGSSPQNSAPVAFVASPFFKNASESVGVEHVSNTLLIDVLLYFLQTDDIAVGLQDLRQELGNSIFFAEVMGVALMIQIHVTIDCTLAEDVVGHNGEFKARFRPPFAQTGELPMPKLVHFMSDNIFHSPGSLPSHRSHCKREKKNK